jgi:hypothetical protein
MRSLFRKALSQYEGHKRLDEMNESLAVGKLSSVRNPVTKRGPTYGGGAPKDHVGEWLCDICKTWKRSFKLVRCRLGGHFGVRVHNLQGRYLRCCAQCAAAVEGKAA